MSHRDGLQKCVESKLLFLGHLSCYLQLIALLHTQPLSKGICRAVATALVDAAQQ